MSGWEAYAVGVWTGAMIFALVQVWINHHYRQ